MTMAEKSGAEGLDHKLVRARPKVGVLFTIWRRLQMQKRRQEYLSQEYEDRHEMIVTQRLATIHIMSFRTDASNVMTTRPIALYITLQGGKWTSL